MGIMMTSRGRYVGQFGAQDGQLENILGAILAHPSRLGSNFKENGFLLDYYEGFILGPILSKLCFNKNKESPRRVSKPNGIHAKRCFLNR